MTDYRDLEKNRSVSPATGGFVAQLEKMKPQIQAALPKHISADRMARIALTEFRKNPKLGECDVTSVLGSIVTLSQLGLEPGVMGQSFLVPYKGICQPIPGWQGIVDLVSRTGRATVWTGAVWNGDEFDYALGDRPFIMHKPGDSHGEGNESQILFFYAVGRVNGADWPITEVWSSARTEKHRNKHNKVGNRHYSFENWEMYGRKVPLLQVCKYMPKSVELQKAMELESAAETGTRVGSIIDGEVEETQSAHRETTPAKQEHDKQQPRKPRAPATNAEKPAEPKTKEQEPAESKTSPEPDESQQSFADDKADDGTAQESAEREPGSDDDLGEDDSPMPDLTFAEAFQAIAKARSADDLDVIRSQIQNLNEKQQANLSVSIENKMKSLASRGSRDGSGLNVE